MSRKVRALLEHALAFDPSARPTNVQKWSDDLANAMTAHSVTRPVIVAAVAITLVASLVFALVPGGSSSADRIIERSEASTL